MTATDRPLSEWSQPWLAAYPAEHRLRLAIAGRQIDVHVNDAGLHDALAAYFRDFPGDAERSAEVTVTALEAPKQALDLPFDVRPPEPGKQRVKDETADALDGRLLRKIRTGMLFLFGRDVSLAIGPCRANLNQVINFINNRFVQSRLDEGGLLCHAAGVSHREHGLAIAGMSSRGKSTLSLHLLDRGLRFVTNDRLLLERSDDATHMLGLAKWPRVNPGTLLRSEKLRHLLSDDDRRELDQLSRDALWRLERKYDVDVNRVYGASRFQPSAQFRILVVLNWRLGAGAPRLDRVDLNERRDLLDAFMKAPGVHYWQRQQDQATNFSAERYLEFLGDRPVYEVSGGVDFPEMAEALHGLLYADAQSTQTAKQPT